MEIVTAIAGIIWVWLCFMSIPFGLPGNWLLAAPAALPSDEMGYTPLAFLLGAALIGEIGEAVLGAKLAKNAGANKSGMLGAFLGAFFGSIFLTFLIPIPIVGTLAGACLGAFAGAIMFEVLFSQKKSTSGDLSKIGFGAGAGVLFGRILKISLGAAGAIYWTTVSIKAIF
ncbi:MAG: DUF456 family protein [Planctomycetota bacterium]|jgi:hypothetical protein|nr:DUF456 family protein [Planctomycetota bacterium]